MKIAIHIRKTDYKVINQELITSITRLLLTTFKISKDVKFDIFTDSNKLELNPKIFRNIENIFYPNQNESPLDVLKNLQPIDHLLLQIVLFQQ